MNNPQDSVDIIVEDDEYVENDAENNTDDNDNKKVQFLRKLTYQ